MCHPPWHDRNIILPGALEPSSKAFSNKHQQNSFSSINKKKKKKKKKKEIDIKNTGHANTSSGYANSSLIRAFAVCHQKHCMLIMECINGEQMPEWDLAHAQDDVNSHILPMFEGILSLDTVHMALLCRAWISFIIVGFYYGGMIG